MHRSNKLDCFLLKLKGTVLGAFISFGISASHLLSASLMSAPAALACAKIIYPETKISRTKAKNIENITPQYSTILISV